MIVLRDYQQEAVTAVLQAKDKGVYRQLVVLATGTGKTIVFCAIAQNLKWPTLVLAHRDELVRQAAEKFEMVWPGASLGIVKSQENDHQGKDVVVASVQTLSQKKRLAEFTPERFGFLVCDEAHHSPSQSYLKIFNSLGFLEDRPDKLLLGVTATPFRGDGIGLGAVFQKIVYQRSILAMVRDGYLVDLKGLQVKTNTDISDVQVVRGDFDEKELEGVLNTANRNEIIVRAYLDHASDRKAVAFTVGVQHAKDLADMFNSSGVPAKALSGSTPEGERKKILSAFRAGEIRVITNAAVLTEGWDEPSVDCVLMCRPTRSKVLYTQIIGRGTRLYPGKQDCLIVDFADSAANQDVLQLPTLFGLNPEDLENVTVLNAALKKRRAEAQLAGTKAAPAPLGAVSYRDITVQAVEILGRSEFRWTTVGGLMRLPVGPGEYVYLEPADNLFRVVHVHENNRELIYPRPLDIGYAQGVAEDFLRRKGAAAKSFASKDASWREKEPTEKQIELLCRLGRYREGITRGEASDELEMFFARKEARRVARS